LKSQLSRANKTSAQAQVWNNLYDYVLVREFVSSPSSA
jgi:hypothetical protein